MPVELSDIRQIEVVRGPNSALFGFNAVGGVINIITYDPLYDDVNTASVTAGTQRHIQGSGVATYRIANVAGLRISLGGRENDDFSTPQRAVDIGTRQGNRRQSIDALGRLLLAPDIDHQSGTIAQRISRGGNHIRLYRRILLKYRVSSADLRLSAAIPRSGLFTARGSGTWFNVQIAEPHPIPTMYSIDNADYVGQLQDIFKLGSAHTFRMSFDYRYESMATMPVGGAHLFYDVLSESAMWAWKIDETLSLTNAVRLDSLSLGRNGAIPPGLGLINADWNRHKIDELSFNSGLVWQADPDNMLQTHDRARRSVAQACSNLGELLISTPFGYVGGIPSLKPAIVTNYEIGWVGTFSGLGRRPVCASFIRLPAT